VGMIDTTTSWEFLDDAEAHVGEDLSSFGDVGMMAWTQKSCEYAYTMKKKEDR
jgi:hypothetical protein